MTHAKFTKISTHTIKTDFKQYPYLKVVLIYVCHYLFIRVIGSLLSSHLIIIEADKRLGDFRPLDYNNELLHIAHDLAERLLPAFDKTATGLPHPRVRKYIHVHVNTV